MTDPVAFHIVPFSKIPLNKACCDQTGERNYRRGYYEGYRAAFRDLRPLFSEGLHEALHTFLRYALHIWSVRGQLPQASRNEFPPRFRSDRPLMGTTHKREPAQSATRGVYILLAEGTGRIKIGWSAALPERLQSLRTSSPYPLRVLRTISTSQGMQLEGLLHQRYASFRQHGEWFALPLADLGALMLEEFQDAL